ncbi:MAG: hypothetical protein IJ851_06435 [Eubacterium sp.]|nr:hypothetical protein [Eubacterium sp.]
MKKSISLALIFVIVISVLFSACNSKIGLLNRLSESESESNSSYTFSNGKNYYPTVEEYMNLFDEAYYPFHSVNYTRNEFFSNSITLEWQTKLSCMDINCWLEITKNNDNRITGINIRVTDTNGYGSNEFIDDYKKSLTEADKSVIWGEIIMPFYILDSLHYFMEYRGSNELGIDVYADLNDRIPVEAFKNGNYVTKVFDCDLTVMVSTDGCAILGVMYI